MSSHGTLISPEEMGVLPRVCELGRGPGVQWVPEPRFFSASYWETGRPPASVMPTTLRTQQSAHGSPRFPVSAGSAWRGEPGGVQEAEGQGALCRARGRAQQAAASTPLPPRASPGALRFLGKHLVKGQGWSGVGCSRWRTRAAEAEWGKGNVITET